MCHNAVDRHVEAGLGERKAIVWDSAITDSKSTLTYAQLREPSRVPLQPQISAKRRAQSFVNASGKAWQKW